MQTVVSFRQTSPALRLTLVLAIAIVSACTGWAQIGGSGSIQGTITDPTGSVVPNATVVATQAETQTRNVRQTTAAGFYVISPLPAGDYSVTVTANGFQTMVLDKVTVDALSTAAVNLTLKVGTSSESVTVTDTAPSVNTTDAR